MDFKENVLDRNPRHQTTVVLQQTCSEQVIRLSGSKQGLTSLQHRKVTRTFIMMLFMGWRGLRNLGLYSWLDTPQKRGLLRKFEYIIKRNETKNDSQIFTKPDNQYINSLFD